MSQKYCRHCWPTKRKNHFLLYLDHYLNKASKPFTVFFGKQSYAWENILDFLSFIKIVKFEENPDKTELYNRSLIFFEEAKNRGLDISVAKIFGNYSNDFKFFYKGKKYYYEGIPVHIKQPDIRIDNKYHIKKFLLKNNLPVAYGRLFTNVKKAFNFAQELGFPLVVKPNSGSLSHHIICNINSKEEIKEAIKIAKEYSPEFIVEKYIRGNMYRATVVGKKDVFVCQKERANVIGNGKNTIKELIEEKNKNSLRGSLHQKDTTLHEIQIDEALQENIKLQNMSLDHILEEGEKVHLQDKYVLSHGCDIISHSKKTHPENIDLFLQTARLLDTDLVGIDFIAPDIKKSFRDQETAILETNTLPYIDMHAFPSEGEADPVAEKVWNFVLENLEKK